MRPALFFKAALFTVLVPGAFALYVPYCIAVAGRHIPLPALSFVTAVAYLLLLAGVSVYLRCAWDFATRGLGTPAPLDPPKHLVVEGLYRWTRNPMYNGVFLAILAQAWLARSIDILAYFACLSLGLHLFVVLYEEPHLRNQFGRTYAAYCSAVPRWGAAFCPYRAEGVTSPLVTADSLALAAELDTVRLAKPESVESRR